MYLDAMQEIYGKVTKVMVDSRQGSNLLYLPLDKIMQMTGQATSVDVGTTSGSGATLPSTTVVPSAASTSDARSRDAARTRDRETR